MTDETSDAAIAAVILPWVTMPNATTGPTNGRPWTADENAAYDDAGGWTEGTDAARSVRVRAIAADLTERYILAPREGTMVHRVGKRAAATPTPGGSA